MKKKIGLIAFVISLIPYAFILFCCFYTAIAGLDYFGKEAIGIKGFGTALSVWTTVFWRIGIIPVCLVYQLLFFAKESKDKTISSAMRLAVVIVVSAFVVTGIANSLIGG